MEPGLFEYAGPGPVVEDGEIIRPGDQLEAAAEPEFGPWKCLREPVADPPPPPPGPPKPVTPAAASITDQKGI